MRIAFVVPRYGPAIIGGAETAARLKAQWTKLVKEHRDKIDAGQKFSPGNPDLSPDLMPPQYKIRLENGKQWP